MGETAHHAGESADRIVMAEQPLAVRPRSVAAPLDILGERWSLLAVREIGYGVHTFAKIAGYTGASRDILADRLRKLEGAGIIERRPYSEHPPRYEYHLTQAGQELFPVMLALREWGDKWAVESPSIATRHACGPRGESGRVPRPGADPVTRQSVQAVRP